MPGRLDVVLSLHVLIIVDGLICRIFVTFATGSKLLSLIYKHIGGAYALGLTLSTVSSGAC
jgi:hypothetical protein